jgi:hypothetical protein
MKNIKKAILASAILLSSSSAMAERGAWEVLNDIEGVASIYSPVHQGGDSTAYMGEYGTLFIIFDDLNACEKGFRKSMYSEGKANRSVLEYNGQPINTKSTCEGNRMKLWPSSNEGEKYIVNELKNFEFIKIGNWEISTIGYRKALRKLNNRDRAL